MPTDVADAAAVDGDNGDDDDAPPCCASMSKAASRSGSGKFPKCNVVTTRLAAHAFKQSYKAF